MEFHPLPLPPPTGLRQDGLNRWQAPLSAQRRGVLTGRDYHRCHLRAGEGRLSEMPHRSGRGSMSQGKASQRNSTFQQQIDSVSSR